MPAWAPGSWAAGSWAGTAWADEPVSPGQSWFATAWAAGAWRSGAWAAGGAAVPVISGVQAGTTTVAVSWTGTATHYRINGGATTALPDGSSPDTIAGLTANTEYNAPGLQLSGDGGASWSTPLAFGTLNPGSGGGEINPQLSEFGAGAVLAGVVAGGSLGPASAFGSGATLAGVVAGGVLASAQLAEFASGAVLAGVRAGGALSGLAITGRRAQSLGDSGGRRPANVSTARRPTNLARS